MSIDADIRRLDSLFARYQSDKGAGGHNYTPVYVETLHSLRDSKFTLLEIGVRSGASVAAWLDFFPHARIIGVDIDLTQCSPALRESFAKTPRVTLLEGDINAEATKKRLREITDGFDVIIDDGSHVSADIIASFEGLFYELLRSNGLYIVEDMATSYTQTSVWFRLANYVLGGRNSAARHALAAQITRSLGLGGPGMSDRRHKRDAAMNYLKALSDAVNFHGKNIWGKEEILDYRRGAKDCNEQFVEWIQFRYQLVIVKKSDARSSETGDYRPARAREDYAGDSL